MANGGVVGETTGAHSVADVWAALAAPSASTSSSDGAQWQWHHWTAYLSTPNSVIAGGDDGDASVALALMRTLMHIISTQQGIYMFAAFARFVAYDQSLFIDN